MLRRSSADEPPLPAKHGYGHHMTSKDESDPQADGSDNGDGFGLHKDSPDSHAAGSANDGVADPDSLEGYETFTRRLISRFRGWIAVVVVVGMVLPAVGWALSEYAFGAAGDQVIEELGDEAALADAMLLVRSTSCAGTSSSGSAFVLDLDDEPVVVTNRHVVDQARTIGVRPLEGGPALAVERYYVADSADVAVLELSDADDLLRLSVGRDPDVDDVVRAVGFPRARPFTNEGTVAATDGRRVTLDLVVDGGASGSPVLDESGQVVAQIFARSADGQGIATSLSSLLAAIETAQPAEPC